MVFGMVEEIVPRCTWCGKIIDLDDEDNFKLKVSKGTHIKCGVCKLKHKYKGSVNYG